jgi:hypothetical protein
MSEEVKLEWRWVDDKGRAMTNWKSGDPPPVLDLEDSKGKMHVEVRVFSYGTKHNRSAQ